MGKKGGDLQCRVEGVDVRHDGLVYDTGWGGSGRKEMGWFAVAAGLRLWRAWGCDDAAGWSWVVRWDGGVGVSRQR